MNWSSDSPPPGYQGTATSHHEEKSDDGDDNAGYRGGRQGVVVRIVVVVDNLVAFGILLALCVRPVLTEKVCYMPATAEHVGADTARLTMIQYCGRGWQRKNGNITNPYHVMAIMR